MNILILGSGGREHAFAWKIKQSPLCSNLFIAPGNAGTSQCGQNIDLPVNDFKRIADFAIDKSIEMIVVGPEDPLVAGIYDYFQQEHVQHIHVIGPSANAAMLEGSKAYAKAFLQKYNIPTATYKEFSAENFDEGITYLQQHTLPIVLKADGLAAGKGVVIAEKTEEAIQCFTNMLQHNIFGEAGNKVVVEEFLTGIECSVFLLTDGKHSMLLPTAKDYKRIGVGDKGLNTGGMGAISPVPFADDVFMQKVNDQILQPTMKGIQEEGLVYKGFIFVGLISVQGNPFVIEYNCRMGDPETEVVLPRIQNDLVPLLLSLKNQNLFEHRIEITTQHAATIMLVSEGYPGKYEKGKPIHFLDSYKEGVVFHAGTCFQEEEIVTNGGRVIAVTALADDLTSALSIAKWHAEEIDFDGKYFREDIGWEFSA